MGGEGQGEAEKKNQFPDVVLRIHIIFLSVSKLSSHKTKSFVLAVSETMRPAC